LKQSLGYDGLDSHEKDEVDDLEEIIGYFGKDFEEQAKRVHARVYKTRARLERKAKEKVAIKGQHPNGDMRQLEHAPAPIPFWPPAMPDGQAT
jgi:hypothetical protein